METTLNDCGHKITKKCFEENPLCTYKCFDRLDCGHACERNCHKNDDADHEKVKHCFHSIIILSAAFFFKFCSTNVGNLVRI